MVMVLTCLISIALGIFMPYASFWERAVMVGAIFTLDLLNIYINDKRSELVILFFFSGITISYLYLLVTQ
ncbi:hypothetical protein D7Z54_28735 [Salibacterium salarium]|uniref:Uncharacterized protein n=1 Tax=Salibacterium salarium TaxID=284579 RepID=A0A3R9QNK9_9BACI|nr:hypothetical protein D7Z54_28735 [Salibacterium salarium]